MPFLGWLIPAELRVLLCCAGVFCLLPILGFAQALPQVEARSIEERFAGRFPGLAWSDDGGLHVAYEDKDSRLQYRRFGADSMGPIPISPLKYRVQTSGDSPAVLVWHRGGELTVVYVASPPGQWDADIHLQHSSDGGRSWSEPQAIHDDGKVGSRSFLDGLRIESGEMLLSWLDEREGEQGVRIARIEPAGKIGKNLTVDKVVCECCTAALAVDSSAGVWLAYRDREVGELRDIAVARSQDGGRSFARLGWVSRDDWRLNGCPHAGPRMVLDGERVLWAVWFTGAEPGIYVAFSNDGGRTFASRMAIAIPDAATGFVSRPEIGMLPDGRLAVLFEASGAAGQRILARFKKPTDEQWSLPQQVAKDGTFPRPYRSGRHAVLAYSVRSGRRSEIVLFDTDLLF